MYTTRGPQRGMRFSNGCGWGQVRSQGFGNGFFDEAFNIFKELEKSTFSSYQENFPPLDMILDEETGILELTFALAGYSKEDIEVSLEGDLLLLTGKKEKKEKSEKKKVFRKGIRERDFECKYQLPAGKFDLTRAVATFVDGLLKLAIPSREEARPKKIELN